MRKTATIELVLDRRRQQAVRPAHEPPVVLVRRTASQTDLIMTPILINPRPREAMRAALPKKQLQEFHELT
jgi:hypothetical protein